jgi:hypothetical protein
MAAKQKHPLRIQIQEVERELRMRRDVYPRLQHKGKMRAGEVAEHISRMESVLQTLHELERQEQERS